MDYLINVNEQELGVIARALMEMPYKTVAPLFEKLNQQITEQRQATEEPAPQEEASDGKE